MRYIIIAVLVIVTGCVDARVKRASNAMKIATEQAKKDLDNAKTDEERKAIVDMYFKHAPQIAQVIDDYLNGRKPAVDLVDPVTTKGLSNGNNGRTKPCR